MTQKTELTPITSADRLKTRQEIAEDERRKAQNDKMFSLPPRFSNRVTVMAGTYITKLTFGEAAGNPQDIYYNDAIVMLTMDALEMADTVYRAAGLEPPERQKPN